MNAALALATLAGSAEAQTTDCSRAPTQREASRCAAARAGAGAGAGARAADAALNAVWVKAFGAAKGGPAAEPLGAAQRAWIAYRDLACAAEADQRQGGSIAPMIRAACLERLTRARAADLKLFHET